MDLKERFLKISVIFWIFFIFGYVLYAFVYYPSQTVIGGPGYEYEEERTFNIEFLNNGTSINASLLIIDDSKEIPEML